MATPTRIFMTGISGYIGGQIAIDLAKKHPDFQIVGLVRNATQAQQVKDKLPAVETVLGDISSYAILLEQASKADIVIQAATCDDVPVVEYLIAGIAKGGKGGTFIQVSGAASICEVPNGYGRPSTTIWDDVKDVGAIREFDSSHLHWDADGAVFREGKKAGVRTALVVPPLVYGNGEGPVKTTSMSFPWLEEAILKRGKGFVVREGRNSWAGIHVKDLSTAIIMLIEDALVGPDSKASWGKDGVYYVEEGDYVFADVVAKMVEVLKAEGSIQSVEIDGIADEEMTSIHPWGLLAWGGNVKCQATRLRALGWKPTQPTFYEILASRLG
jgi:nucleoside-diphosphate-sugar epimerase